MAETEVPEGLAALGRAVLGTDRLILEKSRATVDEMITYIREALAVPSDMILVVSATDTITADDMGASVVYAAAATTIALPPGVLGRRLAIIRGILSTFTISLTPDGTEKINGLGGTTVLAGSASAAVGTSWMLEYVDLETVGPTWTLRSEAGALAALVAADAALATRIDALEAVATTSISSTTGTTLSWEAQERVRLANTGTTHCLVTLNGDTTEWPVGRARALSQYGSTTGGFTLAVPSGHKLNTVTNGTSGVIGTTPADDGTALYTVMVTREASDEWSWA